jgi:pSer/pThr/pTyr-binding forkhead associated (FHA) protein
VHARIFSRDGHIYIEDMNSTNGTRVNDAELRGEVELIDGDLVQIGDTQFRFEAGR